MGSRLSIVPVVSLPVLYFPRPSESIYVDEATVLAGNVVYVHESGKVNLVVFDMHGISSGRIEVLVVEEGGPRPEPGKEYCVIAPYITADTKLMQTICERMNMLQEIVGRQQNRMTQKTDDRPSAGEQLSVANTETLSRIRGDSSGGEVVRGPSVQSPPAPEIEQELDVDLEPPVNSADDSGPTEFEKQDAEDNAS